MNLEPQCAICWDVLSLKECAAALCGHTFHSRCIARLFKIYEVCPLCRKRDMQGAVISQLFFQMKEEPEHQRFSSKDFKPPQKDYKTMDDVDKEKKVTAMANSKANFYLAANFLLKEKITELESISRSHVLEMEDLKDMLGKQFGIKDDLQKQFQVALNVEEATEITQKGKEKLRKILNTVKKLKKRQTECHNLIVAMEKEFGYPSETVICGADEEVATSSSMEEEAKNESQADTKNDTEEVFALSTTKEFFEPPTTKELFALPFFRK